MLSASLRGAPLLMLAIIVAACTSGQGVPPTTESATNSPIPMIRIPAGELTYYPAGEFLRNGLPSAPQATVVNFEQDLFISQRQVSQAEYSECVAADACRPLDRAHRGDQATDMPAVGISWDDATAFAQWLSEKTGKTYRLPTYAEWVFAAGSAYKEDIMLQEFDEADPAQRWLAEYALETQRKTTVDGAVRPFGGFGTNSAGVMDIAGNVWDWTDTCHVRQHLDDNGFALGGQNCGIRVVAGPHRSYIPDFIRDPKGGACSVGVPPSNLGFRLILEADVSVSPA